MNLDAQVQYSFSCWLGLTTMLDNEAPFLFSMAHIYWKYEYGTDHKNDDITIDFKQSQSSTSGRVAGLLAATTDGPCSTPKISFPIKSTLLSR